MLCSILYVVLHEFIQSFKCYSSTVYYVTGIILGVADRIVNETDQNYFRGSWVAHSIEQPTSAQVMISWFVSLSPTLGSVLSAQSLLWILCPLFFAPPHSYTHSLKTKNNNKHFKKDLKRNKFKTHKKTENIHYTIGTKEKNCREDPKVALFQTHFIGFSC